MTVAPLPLLGLVTWQFEITAEDIAVVCALVILIVAARTVGEERDLYCAYRDQMVPPVELSGRPVSHRPRNTVPIFDV